MSREELAVNAAVAAADAAKRYLKENGIELNDENADIQKESLWTFIRIWDNRAYSPFLKILDFEALLYPHSEESDYAGQVIPRSVAMDIVYRAKELLSLEDSEKGTLSKIMKEHLESIINNGMPYGVKVADD